MATAPIDICNQALASIGARSTIASFDEDSEAARNCSLQYESTLKQLLRAAQWGFCRRYANLAVLKAAPGTQTPTVTSATWDDSWPPPGWLYSYAYPSDCIQMRYVVVQAMDADTGISLFPVSAVSYMGPAYAGAPVKWMKTNDKIGEQEAIVIACNERNAIGCYTVYEPNPDVWDASFIQAMIAALGAQLAPALTGSTPMRQQKIMDANAIILEARARDANEGMTVYDSMPDWIKVRGIPSGYNNWWLNNSLSPEPWGPLFL
jgi:hypothetical protein